MNKLYLDFETRSRVDLKKCGAWAYASHPSTDIICMGMAINVQNPRIIRAAQGKIKLHEAEPGGWISEFDRVVAHNVQFEYAIYHFILHKRFGWPALLDPSKWDCTMARALMCGIPASLEGAALSLNLRVQKDLEGRAALLKICKPQKDGTFNEDPALYERVCQYNAIDVKTERALDQALPELPPLERKIFELDLVMNRRGIAVDIQSATEAQEIADVLTVNLNKKLHELTNGAVSKASRVAEMKRWIVSQGVPVPTKLSKDGEEEKETLDKEAVGDLIKDANVPQLVKDVVAIRQQVGKSSVSKFKAMISCACEDGRVRGSIQYHGAHTGRFAGRLIQPQNYPQGLMEAEQEQAIELLGAGANMFKFVYDGRSMQTLSDILRGMLIPTKGTLFLSADYNAIEARVLFWLANVMSALGQYARGESPYLDMGQNIFGKKITRKDTSEYKISKMTVLGAGFGMGWARFKAQVYTETAKQGDTLDISDDLAQRSIFGYRKKYPEVVKFWYSTESAAINAVMTPGQVFPTAGGRILWGMSKDRKFLVCQLPSGRHLRYFRPEVRTEPDRRGEPKNTLFYWTSAGEGAIKTDCNGFLGLYKTWGGELVENVVQATARDFMVNGMLNVEEAGFQLVLTAHDELLAEVPAHKAEEEAGLTWREQEVRNFIAVMCRVPKWGEGCPIAAEGWIGRRYRK